jgi:hypothetical protein
MALRCFLIVWLGMAWAAGLSAQTTPRCVVCQTALTGQFYWWESAAVLGKQPICQPCSKLETTCAVCRIPIRNHGRKLDDGRWLCERDYAAGVFTRDEALRTYEGIWRDLQRLLAGTGVLPRENVTVQLVDATQLKKLNQAMPSEHDERSVLGLTRTRSFSSRQHQHQIYLISGLSRARLAAVCAHEYTHTWLHENVPTDRALDHDTVEGFCELIAYKLMTERGEELEKRVILANAYTRGQVNAFVQAEAEHHFHRIVKWVKTGQDDVLPRTNSNRVLALRRSEPAVLPWPPPSATPTRVPDRLVLKGLSGSPARRFALINDSTLMQGEEGRVRVGNSSLVVRCVEIRTRSVVVRVAGQPALTELFLNEDAPAVDLGSGRGRAVVRSDTP